MSFQVGDEVYVRAKIRHVSRTSYTITLDDDENGPWCVHQKNAIPASSVTVAKARRKAEFPKDYKRDVFTSDDQVTWSKRTLVGYIEGTEYPYVVSHSANLQMSVRYKYAEVEE